jgi:hypothetical protein
LFFKHPMYLYVRAHTVDRCKLPIKMKIQGQAQDVQPTRAGAQSPTLRRDFLWSRSNYALLLCWYYIKIWIYVSYVKSGKTR